MYFENFILPYIHPKNTKRVSSLGLRIIPLTSETAQQNQSLYKVDEYSDGTGLTDKVTCSTAPPPPPMAPSARKIIHH
jgi:hypothetical protein